MTSQPLDEHVPTVDASEFPLVRITYPRVPKADALDRYVDSCRSFYARGRCATVVDLRPLALFVNTAENRRRIAEAMDQLAREFPRRLVAEATVHPLAVVRAAVRAHNWLRNEGDFETASFAAPEPAEAWARERLAAVGLLSGVRR
ncbi:MAG: hypothetical protein AAF447_05195 [Myxococcota bacterium]